MADELQTLLREVLAGQAASEQRMNDMAARLAETAEAAFKARDSSNRINTILEEQNLASRFSEHRTEMRQIITEIRQDFVAANTKLRTDHDDLAIRVKALEDDLQRREGIKSFLGWLMKNAPWLLAGVAAFAAGLGFKEKIH